MSLDVSTCGANLDLSLMLAGNSSCGAADPAFEAHMDVIHTWARAVWESWVPLFLLEHLVALRRVNLQVLGRGGVWSMDLLLPLCSPSGGSAELRDLLLSLSLMRAW